MKYLLFLLPMVILVACKDDTTAGNKTQMVKSTAEFASSHDSDTATYSPLFIHGIPTEEELNAPQSGMGGYGQLLVPDMNRMEAQVLTKNIWVFEFYIDTQASLPQTAQGTGQWMQFFPNGTFIAGHWQQQTHSGAWYMDYQQEHPRLTMDSNVDRMDAVWEIQAINGERDNMGWRRVPDAFGPYRKSIMGKVIELYDRPTREQFAHLMNQPGL
jgi:hypothetical protein